MRLRIITGTIVKGAHVDPGEIDEVTQHEADLLIRLGRAIPDETPEAATLEAPETAVTPPARGRKADG